MTRNDCERRQTDQIPRKDRTRTHPNAALAALAEEARELGALAGLTGISANPRELFRPRLLDLAAERFGPTRLALSAVEQRLNELSESRQVAEAQLAAYLTQVPPPGSSPLPGWRRGCTVIALVGLVAAALSFRGLPPRIWLLVVACLTLLSLVNAAGIEQAAGTFTRWLDYRRARWRRGRLERAISRLQKLRFEELDRRLQMEAWTEQKLTWLEATYQAASSFAQAARGTCRAVAA